MYYLVRLIVHAIWSYVLQDGNKGLLIYLQASTPKHVMEILRVPSKRSYLQLILHQVVIWLQS